MNTKLKEKIPFSRMGKAQNKMSMNYRQRMVNSILMIFDALIQLVTFGRIYSACSMNHVFRCARDNQRKMTKYDEHGLRIWNEEDQKVIKKLAKKAKPYIPKSKR